MSGRQMHKTRYNQKLEYIERFERWLRLEPPMILFWKWIRWKKKRPTWKDVEDVEDVEGCSEVWHVI